MGDGLKIYTFGGLRLEQAGEPLAGIGSRKAKALLVYLAFTGRPQPRETLAELMWAERTQQQATANLRRLLTRLRKHFGPYVTTSRESVSVVPEAPIWLDAADLAGKLMPVRQAKGDLSSKLAAQAEAAVSLYRGEFLEGFHLRGAPGFEGWLTLERENLRHLVLEALDRLVAYALQATDYPAGLAFARKLLAIDPLRESAQRQAMRLLAYSGQRGAALAQYEEGRRILREELGVKPAEETIALYESIQSGKQVAPVPVEKGVLEGEVKRPAFLDGEARRKATRRERFVGRERELERLGGSLEQALAGRGGLVFISGEAGAGKTTLLQELTLRAQATHRDLVVASGLCDAYTGFGDPYAPFRDILCLLAGDVEAQWAAGNVTRDHALRLWHLLPYAVEALVDLGPDLLDTFISSRELAGRARAFASLEQRWLERLEALRAQDVAPGLNRGVDQKRIFEEYSAVIEALAGRAPLLLIVDDLHWADVSSVGLLFHLSRRVQANRILIIGSYRPEDVASAGETERHPLASLLSEFRRQFGDVWIDLDKKAAAETRRFVDALLDSEPNRLGEGFRGELARRAGGHPLFTVELLRDLQERGDLFQDGDGRWVVGPSTSWDDLPARVEGVIERRLGRLDPDLRAALDVASVEGERFTAEVVARVRGLDARELVHRLSGELDRVHRLVAERGLQQVDGRRLSQYQFRHNLFQQFLYGNLGAAERAYYHEAVGRALEGLYGDQTAEIAVPLARHFRQAGILEKAVGYSLQAGDRAIRLSAYEDGVRRLRDGLGLLETLPDSPGRAAQELAFRISLGNALVATEGHGAGEVGATYTRALELVEQVDDADHLYPALDGLYRFHLTRAELDKSRQLAGRFLSLAHQGGDETLLVVGHRLMGTTLLWAGKFEPARRHLQQVLALYRRDSHATYVKLFGQDPAVTCLCYWAFVLWHLGYPDQAVEKGREALSLAQELGHPFSQTVALSFVAQVYLRRGEAPAVLELAEAACDLASRHGFPFWLAVATNVRGWALAEGGRWEEGFAQMRQGLTWRMATGATIALYQIQVQMAEQYFKARRIEEAWALLSEALETGLKAEDRWWLPELYRLKGELLLARGAAIEEAETSFRTAVEVARERGDKSLELRAVTSLSWLLWEQGERDSARQMLAETLAWFSEGLETRDLQQAKALLESFRLHANQ